MHSVLITGGAGFIGQNLVHAWRAARPDDQLVVPDELTYAANLRSLEPLIAARDITFVTGSINDAELLRRLFNEHRFRDVVGQICDAIDRASATDPTLASHSPSCPAAANGSRRPDRGLTHHAHPRP